MQAENWCARARTLLRTTAFRLAENGITLCARRCAGLRKADRNAVEGIQKYYHLPSVALRLRGRMRRAEELRRAAGRVWTELAGGFLRPEIYLIIYRGCPAPEGEEERPDRDFRSPFSAPSEPDEQFRRADRPALCVKMKENLLIFCWLQKHCLILHRISQNNNLYIILKTKKR